MITKIKQIWANWRDSEDGIAAVEATMIFPILLMLLMGTYDLGNGILANQKAIRASQIAADLVTRSRTVNDASLSEAIHASQLAFEPFDSSSYGIDIVSVRFNDDAEPEIVWRETHNMAPNSDIIRIVGPLAEPNNGVMVISVRYLFKPVFSGFIINNIQMQEVAFARGRKTAVVSKV